MDLSVIIPAYNEEDNIKLMYSELYNALSPLGVDYEIIFINDGSTDATEDRLEELRPKKDVKVFHLNKNCGQTAAIMAGIDCAQGDVLIFIDSDLQNDPKDIPALLEKLAEGYDVCSGWRKDRKDDFATRTLPSKIANSLISKISGLHLHDYGCTLKAYRREVLEQVRLYGEMHRFIPIYAAMNGASVTEIPVNHRERQFGESKYGLNRIFKVILDLIVIKFLLKFSQKPIYLFGGCGVVFIVFSFLFFLYMLYLKFFEATSFISTPMPTLAAFSFMTGVIAILMGLVAEILNRTYFESQGKVTYQIRKEKKV
ncbi:glycosyltransferase family 2 protein [Maridesulfovibrio sp.]|uniref:glycosyltransferase family 2 protein n=1 Tax=Maridesulfovibrio sp. TaxID=2795000 RepID=UPI0039EEEDD7